MRELLIAYGSRINTTKNRISIKLMKKIINYIDNILVNIFYQLQKREFSQKYLKLQS